MNRQFVVIISVATGLLVVLLVALTVLRSKPSSNTTDQLVTPTYTPINRDVSRDNNSIAINRESSIPTLSQEKQDASIIFKKLLPYDTDALAVAYSSLTGRLYIEKKNELANNELQKFLSENNLEDLFNKNPELFKVISTNIHEQMYEDEEPLTELETPISEPTFPISRTLTYEEQRRQNQTSAFNSIIKNLMSFKIPAPAIEEKLNISIADSNVTSNSSPATTPTNTPQGSSSQTLPEARLGSYKNRMKYDPQEPVHPICTLQPGTRDLATFLKSKFGSYVNFGITADCAHVLGMHSDGRAIDYVFHVSNPDQLKRGNEVFAWLLTNAQNIGVQYIKFWRVQWSPALGVRCVDNTSTPDDMYTHSNHIHFGLTLAGAHKQTVFFTQGVSIPASMTINQDICPQLDPRTK